MKTKLTIKRRVKDKVINTSHLDSILKEKNNDNVPAGIVDDIQDKSNSNSNKRNNYFFKISVMTILALISYSFINAIYSSNEATNLNIYSFKGYKISEEIIDNKNKISILLNGSIYLYLEPKEEMNNYDLSKSFNLYEYEEIQSYKICPSTFVDDNAKTEICYILNNEQSEKVKTVINLNRS